MPRDLTPTFVTWIQTQGVLRPRFFVDLDFSDGPVRVWTGVGDQLALGKVFKGIGTLGEGFRLEERPGVEVEQLQLVLNGVPLETKNLGTAPQIYQERRALISLAEMTEIGTVGAGPETMFSGLMDYMVEKETEATAQISLFISSELIRLNKARPYYFTAEDQRALTGDTNDTFCDHGPKDTEGIVW